MPDFEETKFDNTILYLEPFGQQLEENRPFFTEGTDLFNKGGLFYSRRIGGSSTTELLLTNENETTNYTSIVDLLHVIKISIRIGKGLGIGFLNTFIEKKIMGTRKNKF